MNKHGHFYLLVYLMVFGTFLQSCSSDDSNDGLSDTYIRFTIDGTAYDFKDIITAESLAITLNGNNGEGLTNVGDTQISIYLPLVIEIGSFDIDPGAFDGDYKVAFSSEPLGFDFDFAEAGNITITSISGDYIEGTFTATITSANDETITLANGTFKGMTID